MALKKFLPSGQNLARFQLCLLFIPLPPFGKGLRNRISNKTSFAIPPENFESLELDPKQKAGESGEKVLEKVGRICRDHSKQVL